MIRFPAFINSGHCRISIKKSIERSLDVMVIFTMLFSSLSMPVHTVTAASLPKGDQSEKTSVSQSSSPDSANSQENPSAMLDDSIPSKRPVVERPEPRKGIRPQITPTFSPEVMSEPRNQNSQKPTLSSPNQAQALLFIENVGQFDPKTKFQIKGLQDTINFTQNEFWVSSLLPEKPGASQSLQPKVEGSPTPIAGSNKSDNFSGKVETSPKVGVNLQFEFIGAAATPKVEGFDRQDTKASFFIGNDPQKWHSDVPVWGGVRYVDLYPGVDLEVTSNDGHWSWQMVVKDENRFTTAMSKSKNGIALRIHGANGIKLDQDNLKISSEVGDVLLPALNLSRPNGSKQQNNSKQPQKSQLIDNDLIIVSPAEAGISEISTSTITQTPVTVTITPTLQPSITGTSINTIYPSYTALPPTQTQTTPEPPTQTQTTPESPTFTPSATMTVTPGIETTAINNTPTVSTVQPAKSQTPSGNESPQKPLSSRYVGQDLLTNYRPATSSSLKSPNLLGNSTELASGVNDMIYSSFLARGYGAGIDVDSSGAMYVIGEVQNGNLPVSAGAFQEFPRDNYEIYVQKFNSAGDQCVYATYLGGSAYDIGRDIKVDSNGNVYLVGVTMSYDFPYKTGSYRNTLGYPQDAFVTKLNPTGTNLEYSTYLGGNGYEQGFSIDVNLAGEAYIVGQTTSSDFPTSDNAYDRTFNGVEDGFITKFAADGSHFIYSSYFGGSQKDCEVDYDRIECTIAIDAAGFAYVTGSTQSPDFPIKSNAYNQNFSGNLDAFVLKFNVDGSDLVYSTFLGGSASNCNETCRIAVDLTGSAYVTGVTNASDFPHESFGSYKGGWDIFLVKVKPDGSDLYYSMLFGGGGDDEPYDIAVDESGYAYLVGYTRSSDFPVTENPYQSTNAGGMDNFLVKVHPSGMGLTYSTLIGGNHDELIYGVKIGRQRFVYLTGLTNSTNYPTTNGPYDSNNGAGGGFISIFNLGQYTTIQDLSTMGGGCCASQGTSGDPILTRLGIFTESFDHLSFPTRAGNLSFTLSYSSSSLAIERYSALMGYGWTNNHDIRLIFPSDNLGETGYILFKSDSANQYRFKDNGDGTYTTDAGIFAALTRQNGTPVTYTLIDTSQNVYTFNANGKITAWTNALGFYWSYAYDETGRLRRVTDDTGLRFLEFGYDAQNRIHTVTDHAGRSVTLGYNPSGDLTSLIDVLNHTWTYTYDAAHHLRLVTDPNNVVIIRTEYDASGKAFQQYDSQGNLLLSIAYNENGSTQITNSAGGADTHQYGARNTLNLGISSGGTMNQPAKMYDDNFRPVSIADGNSEATQLSWASSGPNPGSNLSQVVDAENGKTNLGYDGLNNLTSVIDAGGGLTTFTYNVNDADPTRRKLLLESEDALYKVTHYEYTTTADTSQPKGLLKQITDPNGLTTHFTYDQFGQVLSQTDPQGKTTNYAYDTLGRLKKVVDPLGRANWTCYDAAGRVVRSVVNATGDGLTPQHDPCDAPNYQPSSDTNYDRISMAFYDLSGHKIGSLDSKGIVTRTYLDNNNRPHFVTRNLKDPQNLNATPAQLMLLTNPPAYDPAYPDRNVTNETRYDASGNVIATVDPGGMVNRTYYDKDFRPIKETRNLKDPLNPNASVDQLLALAAPPAFDTTYPDRNLTSQTVYDAAGNVIATIDQAGITTRTYYDGNNRPRFVVQNLKNYEVNKETPPTYNPAFPDQNVRTETRYDASGNPIITVDPLGIITRSCYDALGRVERTVVNPSGNGGTGATDPCNSTAYIPSSAPDVDRITDTIFDDGGRVIATIDPIGVITRTYYDSKGRQIAVTTNLRDPANPNASLNDLKALSQAPAYDPAHPTWNITSQTVYDQTTGNVIATVDPKGGITRTYSDSQNRPYLVVQNLSGQTPENPTPPTYNPTYPDRNVRTETVYDGDGTAIATISNSGVINRTYFDQLGRPILMVGNLTGQAVSVPTAPAYDPAHPDQNIHTQTLYNAAGNVVKTIDSVGKVSYTCYDGVAREVKSITNPTVSNPCVNYTPGADSDKDIITQTIYDGAGNRHASIGADGKTAYFQYDALNRLIQQTDPLNHTVKSTFDAAGNQITKTDAKNIVTRYEYDALSELKAVVENYVSPGAATNEQNVRTEYTYDKKGNRLTIKDALNHTTTFTFDALNRQATEQDALNHITTYGYDANGNRISVLDANGATTLYSYDNLNRLYAIDYPAPDTDVSFTYDASGNRKTMVDGTGTTQWDYDPLNRPTAITQPTTGTVHYGYNGVGNKTSMTYPDTKVVNYSFDDAGRLHLVTNWDNLVATYNLDRTSRLQTRTLPNNVTTTYAYDNAGNQSTLSHTQGTQSLSNFQYTYDESGNRKTATELLVQAGNPPSDVIFSDGFESGNLSAWSSVTNDANRLIASASAAILGSNGMAANISNNNPIFAVDQTPAAAAALNARFYFDPNSITMAVDDAHIIFQTLTNGSAAVSQIEMRFSAGDYQIRGNWIKDDGSWSNTSWFTITDGPHAIEVVWRAATAAGSNNGSLAFIIDGIQQETFANIDNDTKRIETVNLGAISGIDTGTRGIEYFDGFETHSNTTVGIDPNAPQPPLHSNQDVIFSNSFESGNFSAWSAWSNNALLKVSAPSAIVGSNGMETSIFNTPTLSVTDWSPFEESHYRARFYFDPNSFTKTDDSSIEIFQAKNRSDLVIVKLEFRSSLGDYQVRAATLDDSGIWHQTAWTTITDSPHALEFDWQGASSMGANNGSFSLWIDGIQQIQLANLDTDTLRIDYIQLGGLLLNTGNIGSRLFFDDFVSHRSSYIGLDPSALQPTLPPTPTDNIFSDGFETGNTSAWSAATQTDAGGITVSAQAKIVGNQGLRTACYYNCVSYLTDWTPKLEKKYHARFYFDPNSAYIYNDEYIFQGGSRDNLAVRITLRDGSGKYLIKAEILKDDGQWITTNWFALSDNVHAIEINWQAATASGNNNGSLALWIDGILQANLIGVDNDIQVIDYIQLGTIGGTSYVHTSSLYFDDFVSRRYSNIGVNPSVPTDIISGDGFESGDMSAWTSNNSDGGDLSVNLTHAIVSSYQLQAAINDNNPLFVTDQKPGAEPRYRARFYFDPNSISMADGNSLDIFHALDLSTNELIRIEFRYISGHYQMRGQLINDSGSWSDAGWISVKDGPHAIEIDWQAASAAGANNGSLSFWIDGDLLYTLGNIDNDTQRVETIQLGAVAGIDDGTRGVILLDGFESHKTTAIGLDLAALTIPRTEKIFADGFETGDTSAWITSTLDNGHLSVTPQAAIVGSNGLQATIDNTNLMYVTDRSPIDDGRYRARFYFDPNSFLASTGDPFEIFNVYDTYGIAIINVTVRFYSGNYQVSICAHNSDNSSISSNWVTITDGPHALEFDAILGHSGNLKFWVDGVERYNHGLYTNGYADLVNLGILSAPGAGSSGTIYFDGFESHQANYIGLDASIPAPRQFSDGFESGNLSAWSGTVPDGNSLEVTSSAAIVGNQGLKVNITDNNDKYVINQTHNDESRYRARIYFDPNSIQMVNLDSFKILSVGDEANIEMRLELGDFQVRSFILDHWLTPQYSPWVTISDGPHALEIDWKSSSSSSVFDGYLNFWVDGVQQGNITNIENAARKISHVWIGAFSGILSTTRGSVYFDGFESCYTDYIGLDPTALPPPALELLADGFESVNPLTYWSNVVTDTVGLSVSPSAAIVGSKGLQVTVDDTQDAYVVDNKLSNEPRYRARFYFDPNSISMANNDGFRIFSASNRAIIEFRFSAGDYQVRTLVYDDYWNAYYSEWETITDGPHALEIDWKATSSPSFSDGYLYFWIDGVQKGSLTNIHNSVTMISTVSLGVFYSITSTTSGIVYFDAFESHHSLPIGLDPTALTPPEPPVRGDAIFADGFESGDLSTWGASQTDSGHLSVTSAAAIVGTKGMQASLAGTNLMSITDWKPSMDNHYRARFYFDPNGFEDSSVEPIAIFDLYARGADCLYCYISTLLIHKQSGVYQLDGWASDPTRTSPESGWISIQDSPHAVEIEWWSASAQDVGDGGYKLWVDGILRFSTTTIKNFGQLAEYAKLGILLSPGSDATGAIYFDGFESRRNTYIGLDPSVPGPKLFSDGFESGNISTWSGNVPDGSSLTVTTGAAIVGTKGLQTAITDNNDKYVYDSQLSNEPRYRVRFYFDPNSLSMANLDTFTLFSAVNQATIELRYAAGDYQVHATIINDAGVTVNTAWVTITDGPHALELDWKASSAVGANDGSLYFWVDGIPQGSFTTIDNDTCRVNSVQMGAFGGVDTGTRGSVFFDGFESRYTEYIGLDPTALTPPAPPTKTDSLFADTFESGGLSNWAMTTTTGGDLSVSTQAAVTGSYGLKVLQDDTTADYVTDYRPIDETQYRARFYLKTNGINLAENAPLHIFYVLNRDGIVVARILLQSSNGDYQVKAEAINDAGAYTTASTAWVNLWDGLHAIEINWQAAAAVGANNGVLTLWVDDIQQATFTTIDNDQQRVDQAQLGAISGMNASTTGSFYIDLFESRRSTYIGLASGAPAPQTSAPDLIYANGLESGNFTGWWSVTNPGTKLSVSTASKVAGTYGMQAIAANSASIFVTDKRPSNDSQYRARFYYNPNNITIGNNTSHYLLYAQQGTSSPTTIMRLGLRKILNDYQIQVSAMDDTNTWRNTGWYTIFNQMYYFEVNLKAASAAGANDGILTLWIDGTQMETITDLDNDTRRVDQIQWGQIAVPSSGTSGTEYFDLYEAHRTSYIGPDASAPTPPVPPTKTDALFADAFESGGTSNWSVVTTTGGDLSVSTTAAISGTYGMKVLQDDTTADFVTDYRPWDEAQYRARFYLKTNGINLVENTPLYIFNVLGADGTTVVAQIALQSSNGDYQVKAEAKNDAGSFTTATTGWLNIWEGVHAIEINWQAATAVGANNGVLTLWIDDVQKASFTTIDNDTYKVNLAQLGAISGMSASSNGSFYIDLFESRRSTYIGLAAGAPAPQTSAPDLIYANGLESGNFTGWNNTPGANLTVTTASKVAGTYGMQAAANNTSLYVEDKRPSAEMQYRARFYFKPNGIVLGDGQVHYLLYGKSGTTTVLRLEFRKSLGDYQLRAATMNDAGTWVYTNWYYVANQLYYFEINWQAATTVGANNGVLTLWMNGVQKETITTLDNDTRRIDLIDWGQIAGTLTNASGTEYFDLFESRRTSYIGPDASAPTPPTPPVPPLATDAIFTDGFESGNTSAWSAVTDSAAQLSVTTASKIVGTYGMAANIASNTAAYLTDWSPWAEPHYRAEFQFNPNGITMANNDAHYIFYAVSHDGVIVARVEFGYTTATGYQVRAGAVDNGTTFTNFPTWKTGLTNAAHKIEIEWKAATAPGANNGVLTMWVDTVQFATLTTLNNDTRRVDGAQLGPVSGIDTGTRGTEYFDAFISRRNTYIGMVTPGGMEVAKVEPPAPVKTNANQLVAVAYHPAWLLKTIDFTHLAAELNSPHIISYTYDPLGRLTSANYADGNYFSYTYDAVGNRLSETTQFGTTTYTYDAANRLATVNGVAYTWDNNGNLLSDGASTYSYDHANRLTSLTVGGTTYTYAYNGLGDRVSQTVGGVTTHYTLDLNAGLTQVLSDGTNTYLYGYERIGQYSSTGAGYFLGDALGSVRQMTDGSGAVTLTKQYEPYGDVLSSSGTGASVFGFDGEQTDATGLQYLRARYYAVGVGRFVSKDSKSGDSKSPISYNLWLFGYSNPETYTDPSGKAPCDSLPQDWPECQQKYHQEQEDYLRHYVNDYSEKVKPPYINFVGREITPMKIYTYENGVRVDHSTGDAVYHNGAQIIKLPGRIASGLCGQFALAAILGLDSDSIMAYFDMAFPKRFANPSDTNLSDLVKVIEKYMFSKNLLKKLNIRHESDQGRSVIDYGGGNNKPAKPYYSEFGAKATEYLRSGYSIICGMTINRETGRLMNTTFGNRFSRNGEFTGHWIDITGISSDWGAQSELIGDYQGRDAISPWKWLRIYNPFDNETEYYWWGDLAQKTFIDGYAIGNDWLPIKTD
jgi:RHS repeat-associated protein